MPTRGVRREISDPLKGEIGEDGDEQQSMRPPRPRWSRCPPQDRRHAGPTRIRRQAPRRGDQRFRRQGHGGFAAALACPSQLKAGRQLLKLTVGRYPSPLIAATTAWRVRPPARRADPPETKRRRSPSQSLPARQPGRRQQPQVALQRRRAAPSASQRVPIRALISGHSKWPIIGPFVSFSRGAVVPLSHSPIVPLS